MSAMGPSGGARADAPVARKPLGPGTAISNETGRAYGGLRTRSLLRHTARGHDEWLLAKRRDGGSLASWVDQSDIGRGNLLSYDCSWARVRALPAE